MNFANLSIGSFFEYREELYQKLGLSMAELQPDRTGTIFQYEMEVQAKPGGEAVVLVPVVKAVKGRNEQ